MTNGSQHLMPDFCNRRHPFHYTTALNILRQSGFDINKIALLAVGRYENYKGEIREQDPKPGTAIGPGTKITLKVGFSGAVDYMPYQFFYGLMGVRATDRSWEENARRLLAPFEASVIRFDAEARYQSLKYDGGIIDRDYLMKIMSLFNHDLGGYGEDLSEILFWNSILPSFHYWTGNPNLVEKVLKYFLKYDFQIIENARGEFKIPIDFQYRLASKSGRLGRETVIGRSFTDYDSSYELVIKGVKAEDSANFLPGKPLRKKLDWLLGLCMPSHLSCILRVKVERRSVSIGDKSGKCYLGYSTYI